jgi:hypothetical protein
VIRVIVLSALLTGPAGAAPPPAGSQQAQDMAPYSAWIHGLRSPLSGTPCCDASDCRVVEYRIKDGHYEAFIGRDTWVDAPDKWIVVPDDVILPPNKRGPIAIACWAKWHWPSEGFFCFAPGPGD